ncbi:hypothetical protein GCM10010266_53290 [Streptomyces griseomycini]|uniref:mycothiol transferase n=1 Tax=Streptomyces griseomycini TaxID=66895 RepID=UPI001876C98D|nr:DUF664 domain-containing protein [Streptomyces griseomycini]GGQ23379.1 hypothetical protein GCM10010266_53290 [Streptomyces griseomycini]
MSANPPRPPLALPGGRPVPRPAGDERSLPEDRPDHHRGTPAPKCAGLDDARVRPAPVAPSALTLPGLVQHPAEVERNRFQRVVAGLDVPIAGAEVGLRRVLIRLIEECARHNGHADLLRERIDGVTGT